MIHSYQAFILAAFLAAMLIVFIAWCLALLMQVGRLRRRANRAEGALMRCHTIIRKVEPTPTSKANAYEMMCHVVEDWFGETLCGLPARRQRTFNPDRATSMEEDGARIDEAAAERRDG